jgi:hypothetical protein
MAVYRHGLGGLVKGITAPSARWTIAKTRWLLTHMDEEQLLPKLNN